MTDWLYKYGAGGKYGQALTFTPLSAYVSVQDPSVVGVPAFIPFVPGGETINASVNASYDNTWDASTTSTWITIANETKNGGPGASFTATASSNSSGNRTGTIVITSLFGPTFTINCSQNISSSDSVSLNTNYMSWGAGEEGVQKSNTITASGSWTASVTSDANGIVTAFTASGSGNGTIYVTLNNQLPKAGAYAEITYTRGSATTILDLCIAGAISGACTAP